jgi:uncharacterized membrane protein
MGPNENLSGMKATYSSVRNYKAYVVIGWVLTFAGSALWTLGYFSTSGSSPFLDWPSFSPQWIADYLPNWQSEAGLLMAFLGQVPILYGQSRETVAA